MPSYKQHLRTREQIQDEKNKEAHRVPLSARIDIKAIAECLIYFDSQGVSISSRSELVACAVEGLAQILRSNNKVDTIPTAEIAYREMYKRGVGWDKGTRSHRRVMNVLETESIFLEQVGSETELDEEMREAALDFLRERKREKAEKDKHAGRIAPIIPDSMKAPSNGE